MINNNTTGCITAEESRQSFYVGLILGIGAGICIVAVPLILKMSGWCKKGSDKGAITDGAAMFGAGAAAGTAANEEQSQSLLTA